MKKLLASFAITSLLITLLIFSNNNKNIWENRFKKILDDIKINSVRNMDWEESDWKTYIENQLKQLPINDKENFYKAVSNALKNLDDKHSFLVPSAFQNKPLIQTNVPEFSISANDGIGYIFIPTLMINNPSEQDQLLLENWVLKFHKEFEKCVNKVTIGWIIDLTENDGGNMYPMIAAISYFIKDPIIGGFCGKFDGKIEKTFIKFDGQKFISEENEFLSYKSKFIFGQNNLPVVVLIGPKTASSAENLTLVFQRQKEVILAGQPTCGLVTSNECLELPDNLGFIMLSTCYALNANNEPQKEKISPAIILPDNKKEMLNWAKEYLLNIQSINYLK
jgi:C-terminal processing protease CtpA/Prc